MLLKTIRTPNQIPSTLDLNATFLSADETVDAVNKIREEWLNGKGVLPVLSHESVKYIWDIWDLYRVCPETKQIGEFAGDLNLPHNCVAVLIHKRYVDDPETRIEYITSDVEAYIISETGVTVSVINGKKDVTIDVNAGTVHMVGGSFKINSPHVNIHSGTGNQHTGPAK